MRAQAGGFVAEGRINGSLNLSRALGDCDYKQVLLLAPTPGLYRHHPDCVLVNTPQELRGDCLS